MTASLVFVFDGNPVGEFEGPAFPNTPGRYRYMPFRGLGHYNMQTVLQTGTPAHCEGSDGKHAVELLVTSCPEDGVLQVDVIRRKDGVAG